MVKFDNWRKQISRINEKPGDVNFRPSWVINLSNHKLSTTEEAVLAKGTKYAVTPKIDPNDIATPIEAALQTWSSTDQHKELARVKFCEAVRKAKKPANNITAKERKVFQELKKNSDIYILHADKGNATVALNFADYHRKAHDLLDDENSYAVLTKDPTRSTEIAFCTALLRNLCKEGKITEEFYNKVRPSEGSSKPALFYGLVKPSATLRLLSSLVEQRSTRLPESYPESYDHL